MAPVVVWELRVDGLDACEDAYVNTGLYSSEEAALRAFQEWLSRYTEDWEEGAVPPPDERLLDRGTLTQMAKDVFDCSEPTCGPQSWELSPRNLDETFREDD